MTKLFISIALNFLFIIGISQTKNILIEEFSGAKCSQCPSGSYVLDSLLEKYPNLIGVSLHSYHPIDSMFFKELDTIANAYTAGAPLAAIDRINFHDGFPYVAKIQTRWDDHVQSRLTVAPSLTVDIISTWNSISRNITAQVTSDILANLPSGDYRFNLYVVEDSVIGTGPGYDQANIYNTTPGSPFYGKGDPIVGYVHRHVVRAVLGSAMGVQNIIPASPTYGQNFNHTFTYILPADYNEENVKLVGFVTRMSSDNKNDEVLNAVEIDLSQASTGTFDLNNEGKANFILYPNPSTETVTIKILNRQISEDKISIYDAKGRSVNVSITKNADSFIIQRNTIPAGIYYFILYNDTFKICSGKFIIK